MLSTSTQPVQLAGRSTVLRVSERLGVFLSQPAVVVASEEKSATDEGGKDKGRWLFHGEVHLSVVGNSGIPYIGADGGTGYHYGKTSNGMAALICPRDDLPVTIKLKPKGARDSMLADQVRCMARPAMSTIKNLRLKRSPQERVDI